MRRPTSPRSVMSHLAVPLGREDLGEQRTVLRPADLRPRGTVLRQTPLDLGGRLGASLPKGGPAAEDPRRRRPEREHLLHRKGDGRLGTLSRCFRFPAHLMDDRAEREREGDVHRLRGLLSERPGLAAPCEGLIGVPELPQNNGRVATAGHARVGSVELRVRAVQGRVVERDSCSDHARDARGSPR